MKFLQLGQHAIAPLELFDVADGLVGNYGLPTWSSSDPTMLSCKPSTGNPGYAEIQALKLGRVQLNGNFKYDSGRDIKPWDATLE